MCVSSGKGQGFFFFSGCFFEQESEQLDMYRVVAQVKLARLGDTTNSLKLGKLLKTIPTE